MNDDSLDEDSEGSAYDAQEGRDEAEDVDEDDDNDGEFDAVEELDDCANGSGEDGSYGACL
jgi:hypothetical protein